MNGTQCRSPRWLEVSPVSTHECDPLFFLFLGLLGINASICLQKTKNFYNFVSLVDRQQRSIIRQTLPKHPLLRPYCEMIVKSNLIPFCDVTDLKWPREKFRTNSCLFRAYTTGTKRNRHKQYFKMNILKPALSIKLIKNSCHRHFKNVLKSLFF